ncbi:MAG: nuclear transport factor 2 family protein [Clostridiales Family XIII bacterium]|jgi:hypothetical protein|nr:nuclear transport factor 2 family protein [Clostridiales Family XIII bacterium]
MATDTTTDIMQIRDLIERWAAYRDAFLWDKFRKVWHPDGVMIATWSQSTYEEFIENTERGKKEHGLWYMHILGGSGIEVDGTRGISMTKMIITQRINLDGVLCDMNNFARHFDFWEKREGRWGLVRRETICDKDMLVPVYRTRRRSSNWTKASWKNIRRNTSTLPIAPYTTATQSRRTSRATAAPPPWRICINAARTGWQESLKTRTAKPHEARRM